MSQSRPEPLPRPHNLQVALIERHGTNPAHEFPLFSGCFDEFSFWSGTDVEIRFQTILNYLKRQEGDHTGCRMDSERWVTVDDVATHLGVTRDSIYRWMNSKGLPAHRVGRTWRLRLSEIDDWVRSGRGASDAEPESTDQNG